MARSAIEADLQGKDSSPVWMEAFRLAPRSAFIGVNTGLSLERAGRWQEAERALLDTERLNRLWLPRWTLASFYHRAGRNDEAARWGRLALERSNAEVRPALFALLEGAGVTAPEWLSWCGRNPEMISSALEYLSSDGRAVDLAAATEMLVAAGPGRAPGFWRDRLEAACARLIELGHGPAAIGAWNALVARRMLPYSPVGPSNLIGNPSFAGPIDGRAFNWRFTSLAGVSRSFDGANGEVQISFDGSQPEEAELMAAVVWLREGVGHRLACRYRVERLEPAGSGPAWAISGQTSPPLALPPQTVPSEWLRLALDIPARPRSEFARLSLLLNRRRGLVRAAGVVVLSGVRVETAP